MRVLVTGASGFLGRHVVAALLQAGHEIRTLHRGPAIPGLEDAHVQCDILSPEARRAAREVDAIVHLAGLGNVDEALSRPFQYNQVNAVGTLNLLEGARRAGALLFLASSQRVYAPSPEPIPETARLQPHEPYGYSKAIAELWCRMYADVLGARVVIGRFFTIYGPGQIIRGGSSGVVSIFMQRALTGLPLEVRSSQQRDFTYVTDACSGIMAVLAQPKAVGRTYNLATGIGTTPLQLAEMVRLVTGSLSPIQVKEGTPSPGNLVADVGRARSELGYEPRVGLEEGLKKYAEWFRQHG